MPKMLNHQIWDAIRLAAHEYRCMTITIAYEDTDHVRGPVDKGKWTWHLEADGREIHGSSSYAYDSPESAAMDAMEYLERHAEEIAAE